MELQCLNDYCIYWELPGICGLGYALIDITGKCETCQLVSIDLEYLEEKREEQLRLYMGDKKEWKD